MSQFKPLVDSLTCHTYFWITRPQKSSTLSLLFFFLYSKPKIILVTIAAKDQYGSRLMSGKSCMSPPGRDSDPGILRSQGAQCSPTQPSCVGMLCASWILKENLMLQKWVWHFGWYSRWRCKLVSQPVSQSVSRSISTVYPGLCGNCISSELYSKPSLWWVMHVMGTVSLPNSKFKKQLVITRGRSNKMT